jgi:hypothetical protein
MTIRLLKMREAASEAQKIGPEIAGVRGESQGDLLQPSTLVTVGTFKHLNKRTRSLNQIKGAEKMAYFPSHLAAFKVPEDNPSHITVRPVHRVSHLGSWMAPAATFSGQLKRKVGSVFENDDIYKVDTTSAASSRNGRPREMSQASVDSFLRMPKVKRSALFDVER